MCRERIQTQADGAPQSMSFRCAMRADIPLECKEAEYLIGLSTMTKDDFEVNVLIGTDRVGLKRKSVCL